MIVTEEIRKLTLARAAGPEIADVAVRQGMRLMRDDGLEKVRHGMTSIQEVTRVDGHGRGGRRGVVARGSRVARRGRELVALAVRQ